jgi:hypothetical protein
MKKDTKSFSSYTYISSLAVGESPSNKMKDTESSSTSLTDEVVKAGLLLIALIVLSALPRFALVLLVLAGGVGTCYYAAVLSGMYKDPLLARFRIYGEEKRPYPLCRFLEVAGGWCIVLSMLVSRMDKSKYFFLSGYTDVSLAALATVLLVGSAIVWGWRAPRESLPLWYYRMLHTCTRQERRFIGYAWLRIPIRMRWRLNGDQAAFRVWTDMVRLTVIYGAYSPDNPWQRWGE